MFLSEVFSCCLHEDLISEDSKILLIYSDKSLTHYQKCIIEEKTTAQTLCETILKTEGVLQANFQSLHKKHRLTPGVGPLFLLLISRVSYLQFSTRIVNFFEFPLLLLRKKPPKIEYLFLVMRKSEILEFNAQQKNPKKELKIESLQNILEKGKLYKKDRLGEFKEKYFVLTKKLLLILDLLHKKKKMLIFELETLHLELSQAKSDKETLQIQAPHKVFFIKVGSKGFSAQFREKLSAHIALVRQNLTISEYNSRICATKAEFWRRVDAKIANSFANIEDLLYEYKFRKWFFKFIEEKSPEEGGLLVLTEIYVKFQRNLKEENFKEAFKNCNRIYEILKKISADWGKKKQDLLIVREKIEVLPDSPVVKTVKMFHTKSNLNSLANSEKKLRENPRNFKENRKFIKNSNKTPDNFVTKQQEKPQKTKIPRDNPLKNRKISSNFEENLEKNISFHQDFFTKIFKDFDWESCEKKFFYMKNVFLFDGVECQIRDLFANLFVKVVNYLQINYYNSFLNSKFYEKKLRFFQMKKARKKIFAFEKPSFLQKQLVFNNKGGESLENNEISCSKIAEKNVVSTLQMKEIKNLNYGQGNPYSIFSENERSSILNDYTSRFFSNNSKSNEIYEHP